ncbi:thioredoxin family protein [Leisingera thetidis]|uniref:thioredoxin family protein n=1 Tax=Leisingera thetidis TaxID=2930199 RepID=UPI0021F6FAA0|nr:thioredoxin family protein [Leisingera thetidis]
MHPLRQLAAAAAAVCLPHAVWAAELVMVEQPGCEWCARWNEEIAPIYPRTAEGRHAPLRRVDLRALPDDLQVARRVLFTPTFLVVEHGQEQARLEGYPGEDFFWPLLADLLTAHTGFVENTNTQGGS